MPSVTVENLTTQLVRYGQRCVSIRNEEVLLNHQQTKNEELKQKLEEVTAKADRMKTIQDSLNATAQEAQDEMNRSRESGAAEHAAICAALQQNLDECNAFIAESAEMERIANVKQESLKGKIKIYEEYLQNSGVKYSDVAEARTSRMGKLEEHLKAEKERSEQLDSQLPAALEECEAARKDHEALKEKVSGYMEQFQAIQDQVAHAKKIFDGTTEERTRLLKVKESLLTDRNLALSRAQQAKQNRDAEMVKTAALEKQVEDLKKNIEVLKAVFATLSSQGENNTTNSAA